MPGMIPLYTRSHLGLEVGPRADQRLRDLGRGVLVVARARDEQEGGVTVGVALVQVGAGLRERGRVRTNGCT
jgi:hypothetical protein